jgi:hypothetical protein
MFASDAAKPLKYKHGYGSSNNYDPRHFDIDGPGELVEEGRANNRKVITSTHYSPIPCPDNAAVWNPQD